MSAPRRKPPRLDPESASLAAPRNRHGRRAEESVARRYGRARRVAEMLDVSPATVWRWADDGIIPPPIRVAPGTTLWDLAAVARAVAERAA